jgi:UDP-N-acetylglucosamine:LPS N-acetylglucosamine transferase
LAKTAPSFFISHQWNILGSTQKKHPIASRLNQHFIRKFKALLIPDDPVLNITGKLTRDLSHNHYDLGMMSRFSKEDINEQKKDFRCITILSGPEPKRTQLESKLCSYFEKQEQANFVLIRGTEKKVENKIPSNVVVYNIAEKKKIIELINQSEVLLCRSGYSSIMDYLMLDLKRIIFIPTPGQTEQEYLAERLRVFHGYECLKEKECTVNNLERVIDDVREIEATVRTKISINPSHFQKVLDRAINENT